MYKVAKAFSVVFFGFIVWIIYLANTGQNSVFFELIKNVPHGDKIGHFGLFGILTLGVNFAFNLKKIEFALVSVYVGSFLVFSFALIEELSQHLISNRTLDTIDFLADLTGIVTFGMITKLLHNHRSINRKVSPNKVD